MYLFAKNIQDYKIIFPNQLINIYILIYFIYSLTTFYSFHLIVKVLVCVMFLSDCLSLSAGVATLARCAWLTQPFRSRKANGSPAWIVSEIPRTGHCVSSTQGSLRLQPPSSSFIMTSTHTCSLIPPLVFFSFLWSSALCFQPLFSLVGDSSTHLEITQRALLYKSAEVCRALASAEGRDFSLTVGILMGAEGPHHRHIYSIYSTDAALTASTCSRHIEKDWPLNKYKETGELQFF